MAPVTTVLRSTGSGIPDQGWDGSSFFIAGGIIAMAQTGGPVLLPQTGPERGLMLIFLGGCNLAS